MLGSGSSINLNATTGVSRPFTNCGSSATVVTASRNAFSVPSDRTVSPAAANCCSRCDILTVSPTKVYSSRSSDPRSAAAASPVDSPRPNPKAGRPSASHRALMACCLACIARAAATARSAWSSWANGAPKTAITASPTNCMTVPFSPRIASFMAARCTLSCPASWLGSACSAMVE